jgi:hypothetical protein
MIAVFTLTELSNRATAGTRRDSVGRVAVRSAAVVDFCSAFMLCCESENGNHNYSTSAPGIQTFCTGVPVVDALLRCFGTKRSLGTSFALSRPQGTKLRLGLCRIKTQYFYQQ